MRDDLLRVLNSYSTATQSPFRGNWLAAFIRHDLAAAVAAGLGPDASDFKLEGHPGQRGWAEAPWVGVLHPAITTRPTEGGYACYLFRADMTALVLSIQLGTETLRKKFGEQEAERLVKQQVAKVRQLLVDPTTGFTTAPIRLQSPGRNVARTAFYEQAHVLGVTYARDLPDDTVLTRDPRKAVALTRRLIGQHEWSAREPDDDGFTHVHLPAEEHARYVTHRRLERNRDLASAVKRLKPPSCEACGFHFSAVYGTVADGYIEAHHRVPLAQLPRDRPIRLDPRTDFSVLRANCHRALHRSREPLTVEQLRSALEARSLHLLEALRLRPHPVKSGEKPDRQ